MPLCVDYCWSFLFRKCPVLKHIQLTVQRVCLWSLGGPSLLCLIWSQLVDREVRHNQYIYYLLQGIVWSWHLAINIYIYTSCTWVLYLLIVVCLWGFLDTFQKYVITESHVRRGNLPFYSFQFTDQHPDIPYILFKKLLNCSVCNCIVTSFIDWIDRIPSNSLPSSIFVAKVHTGYCGLVCWLNVG